MMKRKFTPRLLVAALALSLGVAGAAFAFGPGGGERCGGPGSRMEHGMPFDMRGMERLRDDLKLDAKQEALWVEARKAMRNDMDDMREQMRKQRQEALATLEKPGADLRGLMQRMDGARDAARKRHEANRDRWLAVYDSLTPEQKEKVRVFLKNHLERKGGKMRGPREGGPGPGAGPRQ